MDKLTVGVIRSLNSGHPLVQQGASDQELIETFGQAAQPLADAIRETIREEMNR